MGLFPVTPAGGIHARSRRRLAVDWWPSLQLLTRPGGVPMGQHVANAGWRQGHIVVSILSSHPANETHCSFAPTACPASCPPQSASHDGWAQTCSGSERCCGARGGRHKVGAGCTQGWGRQWASVSQEDPAGTLYQNGCPCCFPHASRIAEAAPASSKPAPSRQHPPHQRGNAAHGSSSLLGTL